MLAVADECQIASLHERTQDGTLPVSLPKPGMYRSQVFSADAPCSVACSLPHTVNRRCPSSGASRSILRTASESFSLYGLTVPTTRRQSPSGESWCSPHRLLSGFSILSPRWWWHSCTRRPSLKNRLMIRRAKSGDRRATSKSWKRHIHWTATSPTTTSEMW